MYRDRNEEMIYFCFLNFRVDDFDLQGEYTKTGQNLPIYALLELQPSAKIGVFQKFSKTFGRCLKSKVIFPKERLRNGSRLISVKVLTETPVQYG